MQEVLISVTQVILHQRRALTTVFLLCVMKLLADCLQTLSSDTLHRRLACGLLPPNHYLNISAIVLCSGQEVQKLCRKRQNYAVNHDIRPTKQILLPLIIITRVNLFQLKSSGHLTTSRKQHTNVTRCLCPHKYGERKNIDASTSFNLTRL